MHYSVGEGEHVWATAMENWPEAVAKLSLPYDRIEISTQDAEACLSNARGKPAALSQSLLSDINSILETYTNGAHIRLGLGSLKLGKKPPKINSVQDFAAAMQRPNQRLAAFLETYVSSNREASLFLTPWRTIPANSEYRAFVKAGSILGVSQYNIDQVFPEIAQQAEQISSGIYQFLSNLIPKMHLEDFSVDLCIPMDHARQGDCFLLEINPLIRRTSACLFNWNNKQSFDGTFRYRTS